eukprot:11998976-Alexandrium_andersonii.AAC.1
MRPAPELTERANRPSPWLRVGERRTPQSFGAGCQRFCTSCEPWRGPLGPLGVLGPRPLAGCGARCLTFARVSSGRAVAPTREVEGFRWLSEALRTSPR